MQTLAAVTIGDNVIIPDPEGFKFGSVTLGGVVTAVLPYIFAAAGIALLLMIISGGFELLTSAGDPKKLDSGKQRLTNAVIGFIIIFVAYWLTQLAGIMLGLSTISSQ
jgi:hypothetical protein